MKLCLLQLLLLLLLLMLVSCGGVKCFDLFRNIWSDLNEERNALQKESNRIDEEIQVENGFIRNIEIIENEMKFLKDELEKLTTSSPIDPELTKLMEIKVKLNKKYKKSKNNLLDEEKEMETLWRDETIRYYFDNYDHLFIPNPIIPSSLQPSNLFLQAVEIKKSILQTESKNIKNLHTTLKKLNRKSGLIAEFFKTVNFYETLQDNMEHFKKDLKMANLIDEFERRQEEKSRLMEGIWKIKNMERIKEVLSDRSSKDYSSALIGSEDDIVVKDWMLGFIERYSKHICKIHKFFTEKTVHEPPNSVLYELVTELQLSKE